MDNPNPGAEDKVEQLAPLPYDDVRLVAPFDFEEIRGDRIVKMRRDVIVDKVIVEKHTSGADPFTPGNSLKNIPEEHQVDPSTEETIFHRYVAGSRKPIPWPWEAEEQSAQEVSKDSEVEEEKTGGAGGLLRKANPLTWFRKDKDKKQTVAASGDPSSDQEVAKYEPENIVRMKHKQEPGEYPDDTTRNLVEMADQDIPPFRPTLIYSPMPDSVVVELTAARKARQKERSEAQEQPEEEKRLAYEERRKAREEMMRAKDEKRQKLINTMKTPMQIRWELEQAKKEKYDPQQPTAPPKDLLLALGKHMAAKGKTIDKKTLERARLHAMRMQQPGAANKELTA